MTTLRASPRGGLALIAQQVALQAPMLGILKAFWLIVASFVAMVPLALLLRPAKGGAAPSIVAAE